MRKKMLVATAFGAILASGLAVGIAGASGGPTYTQVKTVNCPAPGNSTAVTFDVTIPHSTPTNDWMFAILPPSGKGLLYPICPGTTQDSFNGTATRIPGSGGLDTVESTVKITNSSNGPAAEHSSSGLPAEQVKAEGRAWAGNADVRIVKFLDYEARTYGPGGGTVQVKEGQPMKFVVAIRNTGPDTANGVYVDDILPQGFEVTSTSVSKGDEPAVITKGNGELQIAPTGPLAKDKLVIVTIEGKFIRKEATTSNTAELVQLKFNSYQQPNKNPDSSSITMKVS